MGARDPPPRALGKATTRFSRSKQQPQHEDDRFSFSPSLGKVVAIKVHYLGPRRHEVVHKLLLRVRARIDFRDSTQLRVRTEDQVYAGSGPLNLVRLGFEDMFDYRSGPKK